MNFHTISSLETCSFYININIEHVFLFRIVTTSVNLHSNLHLLYFGGKGYHGNLEIKVHTN